MLSPRCASGRISSQLEIVIDKPPLDEVSRGSRPVTTSTRQFRGSGIILCGSPTPDFLDEARKHCWVNLSLDWWKLTRLKESGEEARGVNTESDEILAHLVSQEGPKTMRTITLELVLSKLKIKTRYSEHTLLIA